MPTDGLDSERFLGFIFETETAVALLGEGIGHIASCDGGDARRTIALHLLAQGYERFLKVTHAVNQLSLEGALPTSRQIRREFGHVLTKLLDEIVAGCRSDSTFISRPAIQDDMDFLVADDHWREILDILSDLGSGGRYHDLDTMLDGESTWDSPLDRWKALEMAYLSADPKWQELMESDPAKFARQWYPALAAKQTETLQRAARAIARMWTLGPAQPHAQRLTGIIGRFLFIMDDDLRTPAT
ncbi:MAG: hypothetical protein F4Z00_00170 [Acidimicrobiaceae bacterium]|nr:hypothetical protein [Acidimicrobiaceae bacterium]MXZ63957.1 hypothetical protein [Acidimicrobiaceae bacterium]MYF31980.1 hypothetical protein [Acidimicrobiaceae bacterium]MYG76948.1 hypothetical protein [Acidimicrobiaceae bacterium]MYJ84415.1 hypothetical protein [Acidimicrobiaceae bacterium]